MSGSFHSRLLATTLLTAVFAGPSVLPAAAQDTGFPPPATLDSETTPQTTGTPPRGVERPVERGDGEVDTTPSGPGTGTAAPPQVRSETERASSESDEGLAGALTVQVENDLFGGGTDRDYTNGLRISWVSAENAVPQFVRDIGHLFPLFRDEGKVRWSVSVGQNMYTPSDISESALLQDDRPYAGWLYGSLGLSSETDDGIDSLEVTLGVVGPASMAGETQKFWHDFIGATEPEGWDNQLNNEPGIMISYERQWWRALDLDYDDTGIGLQFDLSPHAGATVGNVMTYANAGATFRIGQGLDRDKAVPPRIRPSLPGSGYLPPTGFSWYVFGGVEGRAVGRNIFLDGNTFGASHEVERNILVGDMQGGLSVHFGGWRMTYTQVYRTREFDGQDRPNIFGSLAVTFSF